MKITEIRIDRTKNLGQYESLKLGYTAIVEENETVSVATERLETLVDWFVNKSERDAKYAKLKALEEPSEAESKWIATYESRAAEIASMT